MFENSLVSVIIPAYNAAAFIRHTLDSVLAQTYRNIEVIVVDDGSQDETSQIVRSFVKSGACVTLLRQSHQGVAAARNLAIEKSTGEFIAPLDADDLWHPEKLKRQMECMLNSGPAVGLIYTWFVRIDENSLFVGAGGKWRVAGRAVEALLYNNFVGNGSVPLIRRACIEQVGGYKPEFRAAGGEGYEDWDLYLRIAEHYEFRVVPAYLVGYRRSPNNLSSNHSAMAKSKKLALKDVEQRRLAVPAKLLHWAKSNQCILQMKAEHRKHNYLNTIFQFCKALYWDPLVILYPLDLGFGALLKIILKPIKCLTRLKHRFVLQSEQRYFSKNQEAMPLIELKHGYAARMPKRRLNLYTRIRLRRWRKIAKHSFPQHSAAEIPVNPATIAHARQLLKGLI